MAEKKKASAATKKSVTKKPAKAAQAKKRSRSTPLKKPVVAKAPDLESPVPEQEEEVEVSAKTQSSLEVPLASKEATSSLTLRLSKGLRAKIQSQAEEEGIAIEELVMEYLSESVTLRAWEILERKNQMRGGGNHNHSHPQRNHSQNSNRAPRKGNHRGNMSHSRYQSIMDDKASFLEYVRNQERNHR